ncbi:hypothetical protein ZIOFF_046612 [Zingiber officinale]|uniref:Profilin n=1 Tax=Zingiber officinale TaxID=94328 RepID=A0A8J5FVS8_ZINOF|nr:hypothetical protein ZIOFF_046612 [Zingiber officinale]
MIKPEEFTALMNDFDAPGSLAPIGLHLGGTKYMVIQGEPGEKGMDGSSEDGAVGIPAKARVARASAGKDDADRLPQRRLVHTSQCDDCASGI